MNRSILTARWLCFIVGPLVALVVLLVGPLVQMALRT